MSKIPVKQADRKEVHHIRLRLNLSSGYDPTSLPGYSKIVTYILSSEIGTSLRAAGWQLEAENVGGTSWNSSGNIIRTAETVDLFGTYKKYPAELKQRWSKVLRNGR